MTYDAEYQNLRPRGRSSDFVGALDDAIRQNPIPAALVGIGVLWLFAGGRNVMLGGASRTIASGIGRGAQDAGAAAYRGARAATGRLADGIQSVAESTAEIGGQATRAARSAAGALGAGVDRTWEMVGEAASQGEGSSNESRGNDWPHSAEPVGGAARGISGAQGALADLFSRQPLMLGAVGLAIGAAVAATLPVSQSENRLMGGTADSVKDQAEKLWDETKRRGADLASKGLQEAEAQGLTPEAASQAARTIVTKVARIAEDTANDIVERTRR